MDLFNNPMVDSAKKSMSPEQIEEYKKIGEHMYSNKICQELENKSMEKVNKQEDVLQYATEALNSGLSPLELSQTEIDTLQKVYGEKWYERFGFTLEDIRKEVDIKLSRQYRRYIERKMKKREKIQ